MFATDDVIVILRQEPREGSCFPGFDDKVVALHVRGRSTRDIQAHILEIYGLSISPDLVSTVTEAVHGKVRRLAGTAAGVD